MPYPYPHPNGISTYYENPTSKFVNAPVPFSSSLYYAPPYGSPPPPLVSSILMKIEKLGCLIVDGDTLISVDPCSMGQLLYALAEQGQWDLVHSGMKSGSILPVHPVQSGLWSVYGLYTQNPALQGSPLLKEIYLIHATPEWSGKLITFEFLRDQLWLPYQTQTHPTESQNALQTNLKMSKSYKFNAHSTFTVECGLAGIFCRDSIELPSSIQNRTIQSIDQDSVKSTQALASNTAVQTSDATPLPPTLSPAVSNSPAASSTPLSEFECWNQIHEHLEEWISRAFDLTSSVEQMGVMDVPERPVGIVTGIQSDDSTQGPKQMGCDVLRDYVTREIYAIRMPLQL